MRKTAINRSGTSAADFKHTCTREQTRHTHLYGLFCPKFVITKGETWRSVLKWSLRGACEHVWLQKTMYKVSGRRKEEGRKIKEGEGMARAS